MSEAGNLEYRNKVIFNQRGGTIEINNSTDREEVKVSQYSGSNITINNLVNSEFATNNKQVKVMFDDFKTVGGSSSKYVEKDCNFRVVENNYEIKGLQTEDQVDAYNKWRETYRPIANTNSKFSVSRGGKSYPFVGEQVSTSQSGTRATNPDLLLNSKLATNNPFNGYTKVPEVKKDINEVVDYVPVPDRNNTQPPQTTTPGAQDIVDAFGQSGSQADGVLKYGGSVSSATEDGNWQPEQSKQKLKEEFVKIQETLTPIEQEMGNGGDEIESIKRHKIENVGAVFNDYPSVRIDLEGKSIPTEMGVASTSVYKHYDFVPHVEEVDNSSIFPCGNKSLIVGNKYNVLVGSGGIQLKTSGPVTVNGTGVKIGGTKVNIAGAAGVVVSSESHVDIFSRKVQLRSTRQILIDSSLGVSNNVVVGGGAFVEGELYVNHITAPLEVQETMPTIVYGTPVEGALIGRVKINGEFYEVGGVATPDSIAMYAHTHHFNNIPLTLMNSNNDVRRIAMTNNINAPKGYAVATHVIHERKLGKSV